MDYDYSECMANGIQSASRQLDCETSDHLRFDAGRVSILLELDGISLPLTSIDHMLKYWEMKLRADGFDTFCIMWDGHSGCVHLLFSKGRTMEIVV